MKQLTVIVLAVLLVIPIAPILYVLAGGGSAGSVACLVLGVVCYWAVGTLALRTVEVYRWFKNRKNPPELQEPLRVPQETVYLIDWTPTGKDGKL